MSVYKIKVLQMSIKNNIKKVKMTDSYPGIARLFTNHQSVS